jgi:general secretion pathway protein M
MNSMKIWQDFWRTRAPREKAGVALALAAVLATLLWWLALAPALQTLRNAGPQAAKLEAQLQTMRGLQAQAQALQAQPKMARDEALRALEASVKQRLGNSAQLSVQGDRVSVLLKGTSADALAQWLAQARVNARALPTEARLQRSGSAAPGALGASWDGSLVLALPAR